MCYDGGMSNLPSVEDITVEDVVNALVVQDQQVADPKTRSAIREMLYAGMPVGKVAVTLDLASSVVWRVISQDDEARKAMESGDLIRRQQALAREHEHVERAQRVIMNLAEDPDIQESVRLKAAEGILERSGWFAQAKEGQGGSATAVTVTLGEGTEYGDRLRQITVQAGAKTS